MITHRNPLEVVGSYCSMMEAIMPEREKMDKADLGQRVFEYLADQVELSMEMRKKINPERILDIQFSQFLSTPLVTIDKIYQHFRLILSDETKQIMSNYVDEHPAGKHGNHDYKLTDYGLKEKQVLQRFGAYIKTYDIPM
jgi:hypothetical protein